MTVRPIAHVRVGTRPASKLVNGFKGDAGHTLCGAPLTAYDLVYTNAKRAYADQLDTWNVCHACRRLMGRGIDAVRSGRERLAQDPAVRT